MLITHPFLSAGFIIPYSGQSLNFLEFKGGFIREQALREWLNDNQHIRNYDNVMNELEKAFESILREKSTFEL